MTDSQRLEALLSRITARHGFLGQADLPVLARLDRLHPVLIRCEGGRFTCPAQDVGHFIALVEAGDRERVRDVSLPASDPCRVK